MIKLTAGNWLFKIQYLIKLNNQIDKDNPLDLELIMKECDGKDINYLIRYYYYLESIYEIKIKEAANLFQNFTSNGDFH